MGHPETGLAVAQFSDEQAGADEGLGKRAGVLVQRRPCDAAGADAVVVLLHHDQLRQDRVEAASGRIGQGREDFLGAMRERAFHAADLAIGLESQFAVVASAFVKRLQGVLQQRQRIGVRVRRVAQHVVEMLRRVRILLEDQSRQCGGGADVFAMSPGRG